MLRLPRMRCGRCVKPDAVISGHYQPIIEHKEGDQCLGMVGLVDIVKTFRRDYSGEMIRIKASGVLPIELTPEHPVKTTTIRRRSFHECGKRRRRDAICESGWKQAKDVEPKIRHRRGDCLQLPAVTGWLNVTHIPLEAFGGKRGVEIARAKGIPLVFPLNEMTAWLLGLYVAEGTPEIGKCILFYLGKHETVLADRLYDVIRILGYAPMTRKVRTTVEVRLPSRILSRAFASWCGSVAKNKRVPDFILYHKDKGLLSAFIEGYWAGDGYRGKGKHSANTVSITLALQLQLLFARLGKFLRLYAQRRKKYSFIEGRRIKQSTCYKLVIAGSKPNSRAKLVENSFLVPVVSVEMVRYTGEVHNLHTTDGTYLVNNVIVHNCGHEWIPRRERLPEVCSKCKSPYWNKPKVRPATRGWAKVIERDIRDAVEQSRQGRHRYPKGSETLAELSDALAPLRMGKMGRMSAELERKLERCLTEA